MSETICIVIPCQQVDDSLGRTLLSIATQAGDFRLRLHVQSDDLSAQTAARLAYWQDALSDHRRPILCRDIRFTQEQRTSPGQYACVSRAVAQLSVGPQSFVGWLNPGDILIPGALAHIADAGRQFTADQLPWLSGASADIDMYRLRNATEVPTATQILAEGLCDGVHWPFLQRGGVFFRRRLWSETDADQVLQADDPLEEWRLWQRFAARAALVQSPHPLGVFQNLPDRLPLHKRISLRRRIDAVLPVAARRDALSALLGGGPLWRRKLDGGHDGGSWRIVEEDISDDARLWARTRLDFKDHSPAQETAPDREICIGQVPDDALDRPRLTRLTGPGSDGDTDGSSFFDTPGYRGLLWQSPAQAEEAEAARARRAPLLRRLPAWRSHPIWRGSRIWGFDQDWQDHIDTEWCAFHQVRLLTQVPPGTGYVGFPWAALIEATRVGSVDLEQRLHDFAAFCARLPGAVARITTCQHAQMMDHLDLFAAAGVTDIFWPHVTDESRAQAARHGFALHGIAQIAAQDAFDPAAKDDDEDDRPILLACSDKAACAEMAKDLDAADTDPRQSLFALCPAGTGGNSAALWQALQAGAIPVILTTGPGEDLPGDTALWQIGALFVDPRALNITQLTASLKTLQQDPAQIDRLRHGGTQLWLAQGMQALAQDIQMLMMRQTDQASVLSAPARVGQPPKIYYLGPRAARTPLGYSSLRRLTGDRIARAETPEEADLFLTGWNRDLEEQNALLATALATNRDAKIAVISEEPLWDTVWSGGYTDRDRVFECAGKSVPYRFLNHMNSTIFDFDHLPYFLLTEDHYIPRHLSLLERYIRMQPRDLLAQWRRASVGAAFVSEHRTDPEFDVGDEDSDIWGLCHYRSQIAEQVQRYGTLRLGVGWPGHEKRRQALPDWHLDKLARLNRRTWLCSAYENTHQRSYVSEKMFDAFACGALPISFAGPGHRLHDLVLPGAMINTYGRSASEAAQIIETVVPDRASAEAWLLTATHLYNRLADMTAAAQERQRVVNAVLAEIDAYL